MMCYPTPNFATGSELVVVLAAMNGFANPSTKIQQAADDPPMPTFEIDHSHDDADAAIISIDRHVVVAMP
jgi:hypothetical protein